MQTISKASSLLVISLSVSLSTPAYAELEEIIVTARKREEKLQDLPMSVTAIDTEAMERLGIRDLKDVTLYTPGVNLDSGFGLNDQRLVIRGRRRRAADRTAPSWSTALI